MTLLTMVRVEDGTYEATVLLPDEDVEIPEYDRDEWTSHLSPGILMQRERGGGLMFVAFDP